MKSENVSEFQTSDLGIAAFLVAQGIPLLGVVPGSDWKRVFRFPGSASETAQGYWRNATVPARAFFIAVRDLKALVSATYMRQSHEQEIPAEVFQAAR